MLIFFWTKMLIINRYGRKIKKYKSKIFMFLSSLMFFCEFCSAFLSQPTIQPSTIDNSTKKMNQTLSFILSIFVLLYEWLTTDMSCKREERQTRYIWEFILYVWFLLLRFYNICILSYGERSFIYVYKTIYFLFILV